MEYRTLPLSCECGGIPKNVSAVGLSTERDLVIQWRCTRCHRNVYMVKPLAECWHDCPTESTANMTNCRMAVNSPEDRAFLHSVGVRYPDEE